MPTAFLVVSVIGLLFTLNGLRPLRFELSSVTTFFGGWLTSELPLHHLFWQAVATAVFVVLGALEGWQGWLGLALTLLSWVGLLWMAVLARRSEDVLDASLRDALGADYRQRIPQEMSYDDPALQWRRIALPFAFDDPKVEKVADVPYVDDGLRAHRLDVYRNKDPEGRAGRPVFLFVHGGAWILGDKREQGLPLMLDLASRNWVCVTVNYRLGPRTRWPDFLVDVKRALAWVKEHIAEYGGDPNWVVVSGGSAGGHLASLLALTVNDPEYQPGFEHVDTSVACCVSFYGVYDFTNRDGLRGPWMGKLLLERMVMPSPLERSRDEWEKASPMDRVSEQAPPFLVVHGRNDTLVPVGEARRFVELLRARSGEVVAYAELPGAQHAFEIFRSIRSAYAVQAVGRFLAVMYAENGSPRPGAGAAAGEPVRD